MSNLLLLAPLLEKISKGDFFKVIFEWFFRVLAAVTAVSVIWTSWQVWSNIPSGSMTAKVFFGVLLTQIFIIAAGFVMINIFWIRAGSVKALPAVKVYPLSPVIAVCMRAFGEAAAVIYVISGLAMGLMIFIMGPQAALFIQLALPGIPGISGLASSGIVMIFAGFVSGFLVLAFSYYISELMLALTDIARNTKKK